MVKHSSENRDTRAIFSASHCAYEFALICRAICFSKVRFSLAFLSSKPCLFPLESSLEFVIHRWKPKFISSPVKFPADRSKFQFCTTARGKLIIIFTRTSLLPSHFYARHATVAWRAQKRPRWRLTVLPCLFFFLNPAAEIMPSMLFNTLLKNNTTQYAKKKKKKTKSKVGTFTTIFVVGYPNSS